MPEFGTEITEDLQYMEVKLKMLRNEYEQYFLGSRTRSPHMLRQEVQKMFAIYANKPIQNTGHRFKFSNLRARYFSFRRHWDATERKIEEGTYERHVFKANLRVREDAPPKADRKKTGSKNPNELFETYVAAREACGQDVKGITPKALSDLLSKQETALRAKLGCENVQFRVVVEDGKAKLKARAA